jgi:hypothetical protein
MAGLPPPPLQDPQGSFGWLEWYRQLRDYISTASSIPWNIIQFAGSKLTDIAQRRHNDLQDIQGGTVSERYHLTSSEVTSIGSITAPVAANYVLSGPTTGAAAVPTFRALVSSDIPSLSYAPQTSGTSILYGNGSGGFSSVLIGANLTFVGGTLAGTGGGGGGGITISTYNISTTPHNETATANIVNLLCDTTTTSITVNLPTASGNTAIISIKKVASANTLTVDPSGTETIDGGTTAAWTAQYESITVVSNGTNWMII